MKTRILHTSPRARMGGFTHGGFILAMVMTMAGVSLLILASTMRRTGTVAVLNERNNQLSVNVHAAEAAVEKVVAKMTYDFATYGLAKLNQNLPQYQTNVPTASENAFWSKFQFSDGQGNPGRTYVANIGDYSGPLPSQYSGRTCINSPMYRVVSNAKCTAGDASDITGAVQVDMLAALVPITQWAIFYNGLLEFSSCATMTVVGGVHANGNVYTGSGSTLTLKGTVTTTGKVTSPSNNGTSSSSWGQKGTFLGTPPKSENVPSITLGIGTNMSSVHQIIEMPAPGAGATNLAERSRLYNLAQVILLVSNTTVTAKVQVAPSSGQVPGEGASDIITSATNVSALATNFPFLTLTNQFYDRREKKTVFAADIDLAIYGEWVKTNDTVRNKTTRPTILYAANNQSGSTSKLPAVRLTNGKNLPANEGLGFTLATHNPLYVKGHYNCTDDSKLGTSDTSATVPSALMSDALTILSDNWSDAASTGSYTTRDAANTTVNAAILTGTIPSTSTTYYTFSGGVHNLPRLLEDWMNVTGGRRTLTLNTSILDLFVSKTATNQFRNPGNFGLSNDPYYDPPNRDFNYDINFRDYEKTPPGIPTALVLIRKDWALPPPNTVNYYATH
jgi:hypothetical protein